VQQDLEGYVPPVFEKTEEQKKEVLALLKRCFLTKALGQ